MLSKLVPRRPTDGGSELAADVGAWIYLGIYCVLVGCFGLGLYGLMQPARYQNPGMAAFKPTAVQIADGPQFGVGGTSEANRAAAIAFATKAGSETTGEATPEQVKKSDRTASRTGSKHTRNVPARERRSPMMAYAAQPYPGSFGSWGNSRPWNSYPSWSTQRPWGNNRSWH
jgi:hypothetical protein